MPETAWRKRMTDNGGPELISVILPAYNCERTIENTVKSVLGQTYGNIEIIIVEDASQDGTAEKCRELAGQDKRIRLFNNLSNMGSLKTRLKAVGMAGGEWIAFIDSDDLWQPLKLERQLRLRDETGCDIVYTASAFIDGEGNSFDWILHVPEKVGYRRLLKQNIISNSSVLVRKKDFLKYSPAEEPENGMHEDFACWLSMLRDGFTARGIDEPLITYRVSRRSTSGNKRKASVMNMNTYKCIGLGFFERWFYQACYAVNGLKKYRHLKR